MTYQEDISVLKAEKIAEARLYSYEAEKIAEAEKIGVERLYSYEDSRHLTLSNCMKVKFT